MADEKEESQTTKITFTYRPSRLFRVIKVDGAWGGATPRLDIQMGVYGERLAMPDFEEFEMNEQGLGRLVHTERQTQGPIREVEAMLSMSIPVARAVAAWLTAKADELENAIKVVGENREEKKNDE